MEFSVCFSGKIKKGILTGPKGQFKLPYTPAFFFPETFSRGKKNLPLDKISKMLYNYCCKSESDIWIISMRAVDHLRNYILTRIKDENLPRGTRLPSLREIAKETGFNYLTVRNSMKVLEQSGLVEIRNRDGLYIPGKKTLTVHINIVPTNLPIPDFHRLLKKHLANLDLNLNIELHPVEMLDSSINSQQRASPAVLSMYRLSTFAGAPTTSFYGYPGYDELVSHLEFPEGMYQENSFPFAYFTYQLGVNRNLLEQTGFTPEDLTPEFDWWDSYVLQAKKAGFNPASSGVDINSFLPLLLSLNPFTPEKYTGKQPLFNTPEGKRFLRIIKDWHYSHDDMDPKCFYQNGAGLHFNENSWITVQNLNPKYPSKKVTSLEVVPFQDAKGNKTLLIGGWKLGAYLNQNLRVDERDRIWELMKLMLSREFQLEYCGMTGLISFYKGICPGEYFWNRTGEWNVFFPKENTSKILNEVLFKGEIRSKLSVLLENYLFYGASLDFTAKRMDDIKEIRPIIVPETVL